ncbi:MAG: YebC/PmpR family DNA-binding transcriptional regulator [Actinobacteria bacterium]|nr:YebC/PmpR family DNA-binding transcriptional regulator [Actinomycetota bacterium]MCL6086973.1 YebC/PmpR family DNA-binding transcriptional regulator [Actinomycetota bacterium]
MSGHSKWHSIKHKKAKEDAKRGNIFGKLSRMISVAAREGGSGDPNNNNTLANAIAKAKEYNLPQDNIERAIKKGTGEMAGVKFEHMTYEGYGPGGIAIMVDVTTENKNRTAADIRSIFSRNNASLGESGCVAWMFEKKGIFTIDKKAVKDYDDFMLKAIDSGAEDIEETDESYEIKVEPAMLNEVKNNLIKNGISVKFTDILLIPKSTIKLSKNETEKALKIINALDDYDDVENVYTNLEIEDRMLEEIET